MFPIETWMYKWTIAWRYVLLLNYLLTCKFSIGRPAKFLIRYLLKIAYKLSRFVLKKTENYEVGVFSHQYNAKYSPV